MPFLNSFKMSFPLKSLVPQVLWSRALKAQSLISLLDSPNFSSHSSSYCICLVCAQRKICRLETNKVALTEPYTLPANHYVGSGAQKGRVVIQLAIELKHQQPFARMKEHIPAHLITSLHFRSMFLITPKKLNAISPHLTCLPAMKRLIHSVYLFALIVSLVTAV